MYKNMKPGLIELVGYQKICEMCAKEHIIGLYHTGYTTHVGIHNKILNLGGYYTKNMYYKEQYPIFKHKYSGFYLLNDPDRKFITNNIINNELKKLVNIYGDFDLVRYISSIKGEYYGPSNELEEYLNMCDNSHKYLNNLLNILDIINNNNIDKEIKKNIILNNKNLLNDIYLYKKYKFNEIISIHEKIMKIMDDIL